MRLLAAADVHGRWPVYEWLLATARERADLLVLAGDLFTNDAREQAQHAARLSAMLRESGLRVLYLMGNDDELPLGYEDERVQCVHGRRIEVGGFGFVGYQYTTPFVGEVFVKPEPEIAADLRALEPLLDERTVLVTHMPAQGAADKTVGGARAGSAALAELLARRPVLAHIHGHIHEAFGREGNHFNVACASVCRAMLLELPSLEHQVLRAVRGVGTVAS